MLEKTSSLIILIITGSLLCNTGYAQQVNTLTSKEKQEGWQLLFDGKRFKRMAFLFRKGTGKIMAGAEWDNHA